MASPIETAIGAIRRRPLLAAAGAGVVGVAIIASRRSEATPEELTAAETATAGASPSLVAGGSFPFPQALGPADLATADLANAVREGNAAIVNAIARQQQATAPQPPQQSDGVRYSILPVLEQIRDRLPAKGSGPAKPPATPVKSSPNRPPAARRISVAEAKAALRAIGAPESWATSGAWIRSPAADYVWQSAATMQAWARRVARDEPQRGYRVNAQGRIVRR